VHGELLTDSERPRVEAVLTDFDFVGTIRELAPDLYNSAQFSMLQLAIVVFRLNRAA
jgi:hypothetical protein